MSFIGGVVVFDTINRTWKSWLVVANLLESPLISNGFPKGSHDWRLFVVCGRVGVYIRF